MTTTTITITSEWSDARMAYDIASAVEKNFIDARYDAEISVINDAIDILQQHANEEHDRFDEARNDFESIEVKTPKAQKPSTGGATTPHAMPRAAVPSGSSVDPQLLRSLEETRGGIQQLEAGRIGPHRRAQPPALGRARHLQAPSTRPSWPSSKNSRMLKQEPADLARLRNEERTLIDKVAVNTPPLAAAIKRVHDRRHLPPPRSQR